MLQPNEIMRIGTSPGIEVCRRVRKGAIANAGGDAGKGYHNADVYCNTPVASNISEGGKFCPTCEKPAPIGHVVPRTINSNGVVLTPRELEECGVSGTAAFKGTPTPAPEPKVKKPKPSKVKNAVEAKVNKQVRDAVSLTVTLDQVEQAEDVAALLIRSFLDGMQKLPTTNFAESKRLIHLEERLTKMLGA